MLGRTVQSLLRNSERIQLQCWVRDSEYNCIVCLSPSNETVERYIA